MTTHEDGPRITVTAATADGEPIELRQVEFGSWDAPWWLPRWPRWINRIYAAANRYFWLPCPACGRDFGGHEWVMGDAYSIDGRGVCWRCPQPVQPNRYYS